MIFGGIVNAQNERSVEGAGWSLNQADLDITLDPKQKRITIRAELRLRLEKLETSLGPTIGLNSKILKFGNVRSEGAIGIRLNVPHPKIPEVGMAQVRFAKAFSRGDEVGLIVDYKSIAEDDQFTIAEDIVLASWVKGWHPVPAPTSDSETLSQLLKAPGKTRFHMPKGWRVVSNGALTETIDTENGIVETWTVTDPVARSFAAAPFKAVANFQIGDRKVGVYAVTGTKQRAEDQARVLIKSLEVMEKYFGPYPFPSYFIVQVPASVPGFYGSSEQGFLMTKPEAFIPGGNIALFAHELAHGWWGNLLTGRQDGGILLTEALAQYSAVLAIEAINGPASAREFMRFSQVEYSAWQCAKGYFAIVREGNDKPLSLLRSGGFDHHLSDSKGMWFYDMLRRQVGDKVFFMTLRTLIERYAGKALTLAELRQTFLAVSPRAGLEQFFSQWLDRAGAPIIDATWKPVSKKEVEIRFTQVQKGEPYQLKLEFSVEFANGQKQAHSADITGRETVMRVRSVDAIARIKLDPDHKLLLWQPEYGERP